MNQSQLDLYRLQYPFLSRLGELLGNAAAWVVEKVKSIFKIILTNI